MTRTTFGAAIAVLGFVFLLVRPSSAQTNDWVIVPGQRVGPITATTTRAQLDELFGKENVHDGSFEGSDVPEAATIVLGEDPAAGLAVTWDREHPATIRICFAAPTGPCKWRTASGIRVGLPIRELDRINGKAFQITRETGEADFTVVSWRHGQLEQEASPCGDLKIHLAPAGRLESGASSKPESDLLKQISIGKTYSSNYIPVLELNAIVSGLELTFTGAPCDAK